MSRNVYIKTYEMSFEDYYLWMNDKCYYDFYHELFISQEKYEERVRDIMLYEGYSEADAKRIMVDEERTMSFEEFREYVCDNGETPGDYEFVLGPRDHRILIIARYY